MLYENDFTFLAKVETDRAKFLQVMNNVDRVFKEELSFHNGNTIAWTIETSVTKGSMKKTADDFVFSHELLVNFNQTDSIEYSEAIIFTIIQNYNFRFDKLFEMLDEFNTQYKNYFEDGEPNWEQLYFRFYYEKYGRL